MPSIVGENRRLHSEPPASGSMSAMAIYQHLSRPASAYVHVGVDAPRSERKARHWSAPRNRWNSLYGKGIKSLAKWLAIGVPIPVTKS
jgi:hypothetical protein